MIGINKREAIEAIKCNKPTSGYSILCESLDMAIDALYKQIPMKVKEVHIDEYYCPACSSENGCNDGIVTDKYCPKCGQKIDWRGKDER